MWIWAVSVLIAGLIGGIIGIVFLSRVLFVAAPTGPRPPTLTPEVEEAATSLSAAAPEPRYSPVAVLRRRWLLPADVSKEAGETVA